ncbi:hypothetical protein ACFCWG_37280, partial [Streptomyces sp. NPDC056390]
ASTIQVAARAGAFSVGRGRQRPGAGRQVGGSIGTALLNTPATSAAASYPVGRQPSPRNQAQAAMESYATAYWWSALSSRSASS